MSQILDTEGKRLKYIRENIFNLGQEAFGAPISKHSTTVQKWEAGVTSIDPAIKLLLEHVYGINPVWLNTGEGEVIFEKRTLNGFQMPVYALSGKPYAELIRKDNIVGCMVIMHTDLTHDLANIFLVAANKATVGVEKDDLLVVSTDCSKSKTPNHYLVEDDGGVDVRLLQYSSKSEIVVLNHVKTSELQDFQFSIANISLDESQIKGKVVKIFPASLWKNTTMILV